MRKSDIKKMHQQAAKVYNYPDNEINYRESWRIFRIMSEFVEGYQFLAGLEKEITILGSARFPEDDQYYKIARELGGLLGKNKCTVLTGGGPGIMEAANRGCYEVGGKSIGLNIQLPFEQVLNPYVTRFTSFNYFFTRKVMLTSPANAFVIFPGGFGTMDEIFEVVDLMQQGMIQKVPIVLVGKKFWTPLLNFLKKSCCQVGSIDKKIVNSWHVVDSAKEAYEIIKEVKDVKISCDLSPNTFQCVGNIDWRIFRIMSELVEGFEFLTNLKNDVTVLGTRHIDSKNPYYKKAYKLGEMLASYGFTTVTGGGGGVAEAVNKGAYDMQGSSVGLGLKMGEDTLLNEYLTESMTFHFPFTRKLIVTAPSKAFVFFPGGFGTLHQLFEVLTLMQTGKMPRRPVILFDREFWQSMHEFIKEVMVHDVHTITDDDDEIYQIVDNVDNIMKVIENWRPPSKAASGSKKK